MRTTSRRFEFLGEPQSERVEWTPRVGNCQLQRGAFRKSTQEFARLAALGRSRLPAKEDRHPHSRAVWSSAFRSCGVSIGTEGVDKTPWSGPGDQSFAAENELRLDERRQSTGGASKRRTRSVGAPPARNPASFPAAFACYHHL